MTGLKIERVPFGVRNQSRKRQQRYETYPNLGKKMLDRFLHKKRSLVSVSIRDFQLNKKKILISCIPCYGKYCAIFNDHFSVNPTLIGASCQEIQAH